MYNCDKKRQSERQIKRDKENAKLPTAIFKFVGHNLCTRFGHYTLRRLKTPTQFSFKSRKTNVNSKCMLSYAKAERTPMCHSINVEAKVFCNSQCERNSPSARLRFQNPNCEHKNKVGKF